MTLITSTMVGSETQRRRQVRVVLSEPVALSWNGGSPPLPATALNLSAGGLFVAGCPPRAVGERITCKLLFTPHEPLALTCRVAWVQGDPHAGRPSGMGLQFEELTAALRETIELLVNRLRTRTEPSGLTALAIDPFCESGTWAHSQSSGELSGGFGRSAPVWQMVTPMAARISAAQRRRRWLVAQLAIGLLLVVAVVGAVLWRFR